MSFLLAIAAHLVLATITVPSTQLAPTRAAAAADLGRCTVTVRGADCSTSYTLRGR